MGFFFVANQKQDKNLKGLDPQFLRRHGCGVCSLDKVKNNTPKMEPTGSEFPTILFVGEAPTILEDEKGKQFVGKYAKLVNKYIPDKYREQIRYTNAINCRTSEKITTVELNCCYPRLVKDIEATKPKVIFGFGHAPLFQIVNPDSKHRLITLWAGRKLPVQIGSHACWFYSFDHPLDIVQDKFYGKRYDGDYGSQDEFVLSWDLKRAFAEIDSLPDPVIHTIEQASADIELVDDINRVAELLELAGNDPTCGVDLETNCLRPYAEDAKILSMSCSSKSTTFAFAVDHPQASWTKLERRQLDVLIKRFLYETKCRKIVHHLPFELEWFGYFYGAGCFYSSTWEDTESQAYILDARRGALSLDFLCLIYFGINLKAISGLDRKNLDKSPLMQVLKYNGIDSRYHRNLFIAQVRAIKVASLQDVYEHQMRRIPALVLAQLQGVPINQTVVVGFVKKYEGRLKAALKAVVDDESVKEFEALKKRPFNPLSSLDVNILMKEVLKEDLKNAAKGELDHVDHPIAQKIVDCREAQKVLSTYIYPVYEKAEDNSLFPDGRIHPIFSTTTVVSWRSSSEDPNAQNWPKRDEERKEVRSQISHPDQTMYIVSIDYAGIQARNVAMESRDKKLIEAFWNNYDIHSEWRETIAKRYPKWIPKAKLQDKEAMKHYRHLSKNKFVFPTFFGAQAYTLSEGLGIPRDICEDLRAEFFDQFSDIKKWHEGLDKFYYENGYVTGLSGFHCRAPIAANQRINLPIQGDESIIVLDALSRLCEMEDPRYQPMLEVHDDLTFCWPKGEIEKRLEVVVKELINVPFEWANVVPIEVEVSYGRDWINMTEIGKYSNDKWGGIIDSIKF